MFREQRLPHQKGEECYRKIQIICGGSGGREMLIMF